VVIDGRQLQSLGATLRDLQRVFLDYGAVTAANLDGGSSTTMVYNGQVINKPADIFGERYVPTSFVVKP
jgi:exopolysaccharide biosynthesis protein